MTKTITPSLLASSKKRKGFVSFLPTVKPDRSTDSHERIDRVASWRVTDDLELEERAKAAIKISVAGSVRNLAIDVFADEVVVSGSVSSYYLKQSITHAALSALCDRKRLTNDVTVISPR